MHLGNFGRVSLCWSVIIALGIYSFSLSKSSIIKRRQEDMQIRERMRKANCGEYEKIGDRKFSA